MKKCAKCGELKDASCFYVNPANSDKLASYCKICNNKFSGEYHKEKKLLKAKKVWKS